MKSKQEPHVWVLNGNFAELTTARFLLFMGLIAVLYIIPRETAKKSFI
jgi:hypothetical protein